MSVIAVYNVKGGVGKTTTAVNLAWLSARFSARRTLLWDLDPQGGASFLFGLERAPRLRAHEIFAKALSPEKLIQSSGVDGLDILPSDASLVGLDQLFLSIGKKRRLAKLAEALMNRYDRIILDCPPVLNETADQIIRAASLLVVPITPSPLAMQGLLDVRDHLQHHHKKHGAVLPVFSMFDGRRKIHRDALARQPDWPILPMSSLVEQMALRRRAIGDFAPASKPARAFAELWAGLERKLATTSHTVTQVS